MAISSPVLIFSFLLVFPLATSALPLCTDLRAPVTPKVPLSFCSYNGSACCNATDDANLKKQFLSMNISDASCGSLVKSVLCTRCDPFSANLFTVESKIRTVPILCDSAALSASSVQSNDSSKGFCKQVWGSCKDVPIKNSPFAASLQGSASVPTSSFSKLTDLWQSENDFCEAFGSSSRNDSVCFDGNSALINGTQTPPSPKGLCLERLRTGSYLNMVAHPDGSNRVFLANQAGKIWLATVPEEGSGKNLELDEAKPFLDLTDEVHLDTVFGMMGLAFHPQFASNGRLFASFNCDKSRQSNCAGRCACNSEVGCDPSKLGTSNNAQPCQYHTVIAEFTANGSSSATSASPSEVRRIFTLGLPSTSNHGGQILFGPTDGYLYFMMGDGSDNGDPFNFAQNKKSVLGKIMRLDVDNMPSAKEINDLGLWGNYSIPKDNPYIDDSELQPEIWALGLKNPWRCSFDSERPSYFFCADVGENTYEEVDLITKDGNYGWRVYEGPDLFEPKSSPGRTLLTSTTRSANENSFFFRWSLPAYFSTDIVGEKPILVREYIKSALYNPDYGYFSKRSGSVGVLDKAIKFNQLQGRKAYMHHLDKLYKQHDISWFTPVELFKPWYAHGIAESILRTADLSVPLKIYEIGGGSGTCAKCIMDYMMLNAPSKVYNNMTYISIEISSALAQRQLETVGQVQSHLARYTVEHRDALDRSGWGNVNSQPCWVIMLEVLDNLPHDLVYSTNQVSPWMEVWLEKQLDSMQITETYKPMQDPLIAGCIEIISKEEVVSSIQWLWSKAFPKPRRAWLPTGCMQLLEVLHWALPKMSLIASDFSYLPDVKISGDRAPLVSSKKDGRTVDHSSYLDAKGDADIFFPTDFGLLGQIDHYCSGWLNQQTQTGTSIPVKRRRAITLDTAAFMEEFGLPLKTRTKDGYNPLLEDFKNTKIYLSVPTHNIK